MFTIETGGGGKKEGFTLEKKSGCFIKPEGTEDESLDVVEEWHESTKNDVLGSYSGTDEDCGAPTQDADDL